MHRPFLTPMSGGARSAFMLAIEKPRVKSLPIETKKAPPATKADGAEVRRALYIILLMMRSLCSVVRPGLWCAMGPALSTGSRSLSEGTALS